MSMEDIVDQLIGGTRQWYDVDEGQMVQVNTIYVPFGCPDYGEKGDGRCGFCSLYMAVVQGRVIFNGGKPFSKDMLVAGFAAALEASSAQFGVPHTLNVFNAGSFLAMPTDVVQQITAIAAASGIKRLVVESRAPLMADERGERKLGIMVDALRQHGVDLTVRVGIETHDLDLRENKLKKGQGEAEISRAASLCTGMRINMGGYALLKPYPGLDPAWARQEAIDTVTWMLEELGLDEVYFGATCVAPNDSPQSLQASWDRGEFAPPSLWEVLHVLRKIDPEHLGRVHLLPMKDVPAYLAVPSNDVPRGLPQSLEGASEHDLAFHAMLDRFRMDRVFPRLADIPDIDRAPNWFCRG